MMSWVFAGLIVVSIIFGCITGRMPQVSKAALEGGTAAIETFLFILGMICIWNGVMKVAKEAKLTEKLSRLMSPIIRFLFKGLDPKSAAAEAISMNMVANLLGLGNAATPLGLTAMRELDKQAGYSPAASKHMIMFVVINTASLQLIPTTTAALRLKNGAVNPMDILPAVWITSLVAITVGVTMVKLFDRFGGGRSCRK